MQSEPKLHLFIDTNIFLSFFAYTNDDVEELRKLISLIKTNQLKLYLTAQVKDEFNRNREAKLRDSLREFRKLAVSDSIPRFMEKYASIKAYRTSRNTLLKAQDDAIIEAMKEAEQGSMGADTLFRDLSNAAGIIKLTPKVFDSAVRRMQLGNPPGKDQSLGDRINWEVLIAELPDGSDLHIVSKDGDFGSPLRSAPNSFLVDEWATGKKGTLFLHDQLKPLLKEYFPHIKLAIDAEKRVAIENLINSGSFAWTHSAISGLTPFIDVLTSEDIHELVAAAQNNSQIEAIITDEDVHTFFSKLLQIGQADGSIDPDDEKALQKLLEPPKTELNDN
jgi:predicted nucleic acid-binding protein